MRAMHWLTVALLLFAYPLAWLVDDVPSADQAHRLIVLHRTFGLTLLLLTLVRFAWRQWSRARIQPLPADLPGWQRFAARANAMGLYVLLLAQPALGLAASWLHGDRIVIPGGIEFASPLSPDRPTARVLFGLHSWVSILLLMLVGAHVAAALYHRFVRRDDVLAGMLGAGGPRRVTQARPT